MEIPEKALISFTGKKITTYASDLNLDFGGTDEVKAYVATGYDYDTKTIWLTRVKDVPAGTAVLLKGSPNKTYEIPVKMSSGSYYNNIYNLQGQRVENPGKGIYIMNGKKVVIR